MRTAVIITGDRNATEQDWHAVIEQELYGRTDVLIHGDQGYIDRVTGKAHGIDTIAGVVADNCGVDTIPVPAMWDDMGRAAGPIRNTAMLGILRTLGRHGYRISVAAFHNDIERSKGTGDMVRQARAAGVRVTVYRSNGEQS